jgi:hypothetical protein
MAPTREQQGLALLFHRGLSFGLVRYVLADLPNGGASGIYLHAPSLNERMVRGHWLALLLDTGDTLGGLCVDVAGASWFGLEPSERPIASRMASSRGHEDR